MSLTSIIVQSILVFVVFLIGVLLYVLPAGKKQQNLPLCLFLIVVSIHILIDLTIEYPVFDSLKIHLFPSVFIFLYAPLLYFHAAQLLAVPLSNNWKHLLPFFVFIVYYLIYGFSPVAYFPVYGTQYIIYTILISRLVRQKTGVKSIVKRWILFLTCSFGFIWFFAFLANVFALFNMAKVADQVELFSYLVSIVFFAGLIFFTMSQPGLFMHIRVAKSNQVRPIRTVSEEEQQRVEKLKSLFENDKIFTDPSLNRAVLANLLGIDQQQLSREINQHFKMNLSELINNYRIQEALKIMESEPLQFKEIYYQVGFNSRSAFNTAFKKIVKKTPSEYKSIE